MLKSAASLEYVGGVLGTAPADGAAEQQQSDKEQQIGRRAAISTAGRRRPLRDELRDLARELGEFDMKPGQTLTRRSSGDMTTVMLLVCCSSSSWS